MKRKIMAVFAAIAIIAFIGGCATTQTGEQTMETRRLTALKWFNDNYEQYLDAYDIASPVVQEEWKEKIDPIFETMSGIFDAWKIAMDSGNVEEAENAEDAYLALKTKLLSMLIERDIINVEFEIQTEE